MATKTTTTKKKKGSVPPILPREPLTQKAKAAIFTYVEHHEGGKMFALGVVNRALEAERKRRSDLYAWLEERGYKWEPKLYKSFWHKPAKRIIGELKQDKE